MDTTSHVNGDVLTDEDRLLFETFVRIRKQERKSPEKSPVEGIAPRTLRRYIVNEETPTRLEDSTRIAMARYLTKRGVEGFEHLTGQDGAEEEGGEASKPPLSKLWEILDRESRTAEKRADAIFEMAVAARIAEENARDLIRLTSGEKSDPEAERWAQQVREAIRLEAEEARQAAGPKGAATQRKGRTPGEKSGSRQSRD